MSPKKIKVVDNLWKQCVITAIAFFLCFSFKNLFCQKITIAKINKVDHFKF